MTPDPPTQHDDYAYVLTSPYDCLVSGIVTSASNIETVTSECHNLLPSSNSWLTRRGYWTSQLVAIQWQLIDDERGGIRSRQLIGRKKRGSSKATRRLYQVLCQLLPSSNIETVSRVAMIQQWQLIDTKGGRRTATARCHPVTADWLERMHGEEERRRREVHFIIVPIQ